MILVWGLLLSVGVGYLRGGRLKYYEAHPLRWILLPIAAFLLEAALSWLGSRWLVAITVAEYACLAGFIAGNFRRFRTAMTLCALATALNFLVIAANGFSMPVSPVVHDFPALAGFADRVIAGELPEYVLVGCDAPLWFLGDTIPVPVLVPGLASVGDILLAAGLFVLIQGIMKKPAEGGVSA